MSRYFKYYNTRRLEVVDVDRLKNFIEINKKEECNGLNLSHLIHLDYEPNPEENKLDWYVTIGLKYENDFEYNINHFSPEDCTTQIFWSEISRCVKPFETLVTDEEFPVVDDDSTYAWIIKCNNTELIINKITCQKGDKLENISTFQDISDKQ